jgi:transcription termination factor NusB
LETSFQNKYFENSPVMDIIKDCKSLVTYFKHSSLNSKLEKSLKQETETRWNSKLEMLESIYDQFEEISELLSDKDEFSRIENIDKNILQILIDFLKNFGKQVIFWKVQNILPYIW